LKSTFNIGVVGCGDISGIYFEQCRKFDALNLVACSDLDPSRAEARAGKFGVQKILTTDALLLDPEIDIVLNLTPPATHFEVSLAALVAGKHVYSEKPLAIDRPTGLKLIDEANSRNLRIGCAPDTFMGAGIQTAIRLLDDGSIGKPAAATAFMVCHGHEHWHPSPEFYYQPGGGPLFDMGPYYLTALVVLLGPVRRVTGSARISFPERTITSEPKKGKVVKVEVPTHVAGVLDFASGAVATLIMSFDVWSANLPRIEIYGSEASLSVPDPNGFGGPVRLRAKSDDQWREMELPFPYVDNSRGIGVAEMARAIASDRPHRAAGELAYHVLDVMHALHEASDRGRHVVLESSCERPEPLPVGLALGQLPD
jgi:predicted dehydrogenase